MFLLQLLRMPASLSILLEVIVLITPPSKLGRERDYLHLFASFLRLFQPIVNKINEDRLLFKYFCFKFAQIKLVSSRPDKVFRYSYESASLKQLYKSLQICLN